MSTTRDNSEHLLTRICLIALGTALAAGVISGCNSEDPVLRNDGAYCTPEPESRTKDCIVEGPRDNLGDLFINSVEDLKNICQTKCNTIEDLALREIEGLKNLKAFTGIGITGGASIEDHPDLETTNGLQLEDGAALTVLRNPSLREVVGLGKLTTTVALDFEANPNLEEIHGLENLEEIFSGSENHEGLSSFRLVGTSVDSLDALDGLEMHQNTAFRLERNPDLRAVPELRGEARYVTVENNEDMTDVSGIAGMDKIWNSLTITDNPNVKNCEARRVADQVSYYEMADRRISGNSPEDCE